MVAYPRLAACLLLVIMVPAALPGGAGDPVRTDAQIEEDWLLQARLRLGALAQERQARPELDAQGGCDGLIDGGYGFHTRLEENPWWQVDLGSPLPLDRVLVWNRKGFEARAARLQVRISVDGVSFSEAYRHDGTPFGADGKPLEVRPGGVRARVLRLQLPGREYLHLDEVQVYSGGVNAALRRPATQSSVSEWSTVKDAHPAWGPVLRTTLEGGLRLAAALELQGVDAGPARRALEALRDAPAPATDEGWKQRYLSARRAIRPLALSNPLLDFDSLVFAKRAPGLFPHLSDQNYGWWSRPGGGVFVLRNFKSDRPELQPVGTGFPEGSFLQPELSPDGRKVLVAFARHFPHVRDLRDKMTKSNLPEEAFYHLHEIDLATGASRRLTRGRYDDFDARYLPDGDLAFLSTRKGVFLQCTPENSARTLAEDLPDSYVRCGGDRSRPVPVYTLHAMGPDGSKLRPLSAFETFEYTPSVAPDGRILYCRWDYIDRFNGHFFSLWSCNPDGSTARLVYGNYTERPQATMEPRAIPGSDKLIFTASAHHSITGGSLVLLDPSRGDEGLEPLTRLTPEVPFPETERNVGSYYANPWPLSEDFHLVSWSCRKLPPHCRTDSSEDNPVNAQGLYLYDRFGNLELLYRDPAISSMNPIPLKPRPLPRARAPVAATPSLPPNSGAFLLQDVYEGLDLVPRGAVKRLRVVGVLPKVQPEMHQPPIGPSKEDTGKFVLGTVPVEADGSAHFQAPSGVPVFFQALDGEGRSLQTMRTVTYLKEGQTLSCIGCHEPRGRASQPPAPPLAARRGPSRLDRDVEGSLPLRFDTIVQPVLDARCVSCHRPDGEARGLDLSAPRSYESLLGWSAGDLRKLVHERDVSRVNDGPALNSKLLRILKEDAIHASLPISDGERRRLYAWMDLYAPTVGSFSPEQERDLRNWVRDNSALFEPSR